MTYLDDILNIAHNSEPADKFNVFLTSFRSPEKGKFVYVFYEGSDDSFFYNYYIGKIYTDYEIISPWSHGCEGKSVANKIYSSVKDWSKGWSKYPQSQFLFFCDRDYDDILDQAFPFQLESNVFTTCYYSIENYLIQKNVLYHMLDLLTVPPKVNIQKIKVDLYTPLNKSFNSIFREFLKKIHNLTLFCIICRLYEKRHNLGRQMTLDNIKITKLFSVSFSQENSSNPILQIQLSEEYKLMVEDIPKYLIQTAGANPLSQKIKQEDLDSISTKLAQIHDRVIFTRGKWISKFLINVVFEKIVSILRKKIKDKTNQKVANRLSVGSTVQIFNSIIHKKYFPSTLRQFLEVNLNNLT